MLVKSSTQRSRTCRVPCGLPCNPLSFPEVNGGMGCVTAAGMVVAIQLFVLEFGANQVSELNIMI